MQWHVIGVPHILHSILMTCHEVFLTYIGEVAKI